MLTPEENEMMALSEVARYMVRDVKSVTAESNLQEASRLMAQFGIGSLLVKKADQLVGILTETDMARRGMATDVNPQKTSVESLMSAPIITIEGYKTVEEAHGLMKTKGIRHLPVTEEGKIVGMLSLSDLVRYYASGFQTTE